jgi:hypothetical protein
VADRNNGRMLFDRSKPTAGCSASGRRRRTKLEFSRQILMKPAVVTLNEKPSMLTDRYDEDDINCSILYEPA